MSFLGRLFGRGTDSKQQGESGASGVLSSESPEASESPGDGGLYSVLGSSVVNVLTIEERVASLDSQLDAICERAMGRLDFEVTDEISQAIRGYYTDHYRVMMATEYIFDSLIDGGLRPGQGSLRVSIDQSGVGRCDLPRGVELESHIMQGYLDDVALAACRVLDGDKLNAAAEMYRMLIDGQLPLQEVSVGVTTLSEDDVVMLNRYTSAMIERIEMATGVDSSQLIPQGEGAVQSSVEARLDFAKSEFSVELRPAGQLLFHLTPGIDRVLGSGEVRAGVLGGGRELVHFSEQLILSQYRDLKQSLNPEVVTLQGVLVVPISNIIETTPYARGGLYGVAISRSPETILYKSSSPVNSAEMYYDRQPSGSGYDRVFYRDIKTASSAKDYAYSLYSMRAEYSTIAWVIVEGSDVSEYNQAVDSPEGRQALRHYDDTTVPDYFGERFGSSGSGLPDIEMVGSEGVVEVVERVVERANSSQVFSGRVVLPLRGGVYATTSPDDDPLARDGSKLSTL